MQAARLGHAEFNGWNEFYIKKWANVVEFATKLERLPGQNV
jgi:hypothetical protein